MTPAGTTAVSCVADWTAKEAAGRPLNHTAVVPASPLPVSVTAWPGVPLLGASVATTAKAPWSYTLARKTRLKNEAPGRVAAPNWPTPRYVPSRYMPPSASRARAWPVSSPAPDEPSAHCQAPAASSLATKASERPWVPLSAKAVAPN